MNYTVIVRVQIGTNLKTSALLSFLKKTKPKPSKYRLSCLAKKKNKQPNKWTKNLKCVDVYGPCIHFIALKSNHNVWRYHYVAFELHLFLAPVLIQDQNSSLIFTLPVCFPCSSTVKWKILIFCLYSYTFPCFFNKWPLNLYGQLQLYLDPLLELITNLIFKSNSEIYIY